MRTCLTLLSLVLGASVPPLAQSQTAPPPQTARQALIEMFLGKATDDLAKHLPDVARQALLRKGETPESSWALRISEIGRQAVAQGEHIETFDTGPIILVSEQNDGHEKIEVAVEHDILLGEDDEIELSIHVYKDGQPEPLPVLPRLTFTFRQDQEVWRLTELTAAAHVPLTDPDYLKSLRQQQNEENESAAQARLSGIVMSEKQYAGEHPDRGYTCALSDLFGDGSQGGSENEWSGYHFALTGCVGSPASKYRIDAVPIDPDSGMKTFCGDQSGTVKSLASGKKSDCFSHGQVVSSQTSTSFVAD